MSSMDRNQKLKNYHARKVRERQQQQQQNQQKENVDGNTNNIHSTNGPSPSISTNYYSTTTTTTTVPKLSTVSRGLGEKMIPSLGGGKAVSAAAAAVEGGLLNVQNSSDRNGQYSNDTTTTTITTKSFSRSSRSLFTNVANTTTTNNAASSNEEGSLVGRIAIQDKAAGSPPSLSSLAAMNEITEKEKSAPTSSSSRNGTTLGGRTTITTTTQNLLGSGGVSGGDNDDNNNTTTTTNNAAAAARMFAARRRRAQLEMSTGDYSATTPVVAISAGAAGAGGGGGTVSTTTTSSSNSTRDISDNNKHESMIGRGRDSIDNSIGSSKSIGSWKSARVGGGGGGGGTLASRKAYERYVGSSSSSNSVSSSGDGRNRPSSANSRMGGIHTMNSMDSMDASSIASVSSSAADDYGHGLSTTPSVLSNTNDMVGMDVGGGVSDDATREGMKSLATVREESSSSFSSMATIQVSNRQKKKTTVEVKSDNDVRGGGSNSDGARSGDDYKNAAPTPILRQPHHHNRETKNHPAPATKDEEDDGHSSKAVRFHLSPLERQKKVDKAVAKKVVVVAQHDDDDISSSISALPFVTESTSPPPRATANNIIQNDIGDDNGAQSSLSKSSISLMGSDCNTNKSTPQTINEASQEIDVATGDEEQDEEFAIFLNGLRREVSGDHTKLWSEFQSIMGRAPQEHVPLYHHPNGGESVEDKDDPKKKKKKVRMDPQTTKTLNAIYKQFHEEDQRTKSSSRRFMTNKSQLKNDKDIAKQQREEEKRARDEVARAEEHSRDRRMGDRSPVRHPQEEARVKSISKSPQRSNQNNTSSGGENELEAVKLRPTPTRSSTKSEPDNSSTSSPKDELFSVKLRPTPTKTPPPTNTSIKSVTTPTPQKSFTIGVGSSASKIPRLLQRSSSKSNSGRSISSGDEKEKKRTNWMDSLKKKQKSLQSKQMADYSSRGIPLQVETGDSLDTDSVVLKGVSHRKKLRISPPCSPEEKEGQVPPWAKVQLRSTTQRREELLFDTPTGSSVGGDSTPKSFTPTAADSLPPLCCVGDTIDLDSLPKRLFPGEAATVFPLKNKNANDDSEQFVIVGTIAIVTASSSAGNNGRKVDITWWCRRSTIRTLTLNVEATGATLAHANGRMPLLFESSDIGLNFAQAFYRGPSKPVTPVSSQPRPPPAQKEDPKESANKEFDSKKEDSSSQVGNGNVEVGLTEAEVSLLDEYRHFDENEKPKLRLVCLSPKGEEEVVEVTMPARNLANNTATDESDASKKKEGSGPSLTNEEEKSVSKYKKMLAVGLPPDAVRNKMTLEGASANVVAAVLGKPFAEEDKPALPKLRSSKMSEEEEKMVSKYKKMLMMGIPPGAVRHKMVTEGVPSNVVAAVLGADENESTKSAEKKTKDEGEVEVADPRQALLAAIKKKGKDGDRMTPATDPKQALFDAIKDRGAEPSKTKLSDEEDRIASKFRRMLKMGIPLEAVQHGMKKEGVDPKIAAAVAEEAPPQAAVSEPMTPAKPKSGSTAGPILSEEEEKIASKYRKMLKLCIPKDAVRHDMKKEGVSDKIVEAIFGKEDTSKTDNNMETPARGKNTKTIGFHWQTANLPPELFEKTIFARSATKKRKHGTINPEEGDIKKLEELFPKKDNSNTGKVKSGQSNAGNGMAKLLDITRANNVAIQLKAFNDFTLRALAETINDLDPDNKIVGERVQFIPQLLPTPKELQAIKAYKGDSDRLITAELFFQQLLPVKRFEDKVEVMKAMCTFNEHAEEARAAFKTLEEVCGQITNSANLEQIVSFVLNTGNLMNEGSLDGGVEAFKFESLLKLTQTKSADGKTTVLDYIVETFIEKGERQTLFLNSDFPDIQESCRLSINDLCGDVNTLRKNYQLCKTELDRMKKDQAPKPAKSIPKKTNEGETADPRKALFAAIQKRGANDDDNTPKPPAPVDPRQALFAAIKNKGADASNIASVSTPNIKYSRGVKKLESFIWKAEATLSLTERDQGAAIRACKALAVLCGEEGGERSATSLLQILSTFASSLVAAVEKYDKRAEVSKRQKAQNKSAPLKKEKENQVNALPKKEPLLKASSLQPHVGLTDKVKRANVDSNTSSSVTAKSRLSPETRNTLASSNDGDARSAMFAAIKSRNERPVGVTNKVRTINTNVQRKESRVLMVNKMLKEAPANVRDDFLRGVTYRETSDPLLQKIYEKEGVEVDDTADDLKPIDPRQELFAAIKSRRQG